MPELLDAAVEQYALQVLYEHRKEEKTHRKGLQRTAAAATVPAGSEISSSHAEASLQAMSVKELKRLARGNGAPADAVENLDDAGDVKAAAIALVIRHTVAAPAQEPVSAAAAAAQGNGRGGDAHRKQEVAKMINASAVRAAVEETQNLLRERELDEQDAHDATKPSAQQREAQQRKEGAKTKRAERADKQLAAKSSSRSGSFSLDSIFLNSLGGDGDSGEGAAIVSRAPGLRFSGSDSDGEDGDSDLERWAEPVKKNRRGQRARQKLAEKKFGQKAKHVQKVQKQQRKEAAMLAQRLLDQKAQGEEGEGGENRKQRRRREHEEQKRRQEGSGFLQMASHSGNLRAADVAATGATDDIGDTSVAISAPFVAAAAAIANGRSSDGKQRANAVESDGNPKPRKCSKKKTGQDTKLDGEATFGGGGVELLENLHPSWVAKQEQKRKQALLAVAAGNKRTRVIFDDDE